LRGHSKAGHQQARASCPDDVKSGTKSGSGALTIACGFAPAAAKQPWGAFRHDFAWPSRVARPVGRNRKIFRSPFRLEIRQPALTDRQKSKLDWHNLSWATRQRSPPRVQSGFLSRFSWKTDSR